MLRASPLQNVCQVERDGERETSSGVFDGCII